MPHLLREHGVDCILRSTAVASTLVRISPLSRRIATRSSTRGNAGLRLGVGEGQAADQRDFRILQSSPTHVLARAQRRRGSALGDRVRVGADAAARSSSGTTSSSPSRPEERAPRGGTRTRPTGVATSTTGASPVGCRCTTSTSATAACTSSTAATATACSSTASPTDVQSDLLCCEPDESRTVACPIRARQRHVPPRQDAAHDDRQHHRRVAAHPHPAPARRGHRGRGRPLPVEGLREPVHRRADRARIALTAENRGFVARPTAGRLRLTA